MNVVWKRVTFYNNSFYKNLILPQQQTLFFNESTNIAFNWIYRSSIKDIICISFILTKSLSNITFSL